VPLTVERVSSGGVSFNNGILDVQVVGLDSCVPANGLATLEAVDFGIVDLPGDQVRAVGEATLSRRVGIPPGLTIG
jgi:hypothetical protein